MDWTLEIGEEAEKFDTREQLLARVADMLEDYLSTSPLADATVTSPLGQELDIDLGLRLVEIEA